MDDLRQTWFDTHTGDLRDVPPRMDEKPVRRRESVPVVLPESGVEVDISTPEGAVQALDAFAELRNRISAVSRLARQALVEEADRRGELSFRVDGRMVRVSGEPERVVEYDIPLLRHQLREAGLPEERLDVLVIEKFSVDGRVVRQLERNPVYAEILAACVKGATVKDRRVTLG